LFAAPVAPSKRSTDRTSRYRSQHLLAGVTLRPVSTFLRYVRIQAMVLVCGIVGPIFLVLYFAIEPTPTDKWMYYLGLIITAIDVLIALALTAGKE
jgi:hypothetical protein